MSVSVPLPAHPAPGRALGILSAPFVLLQPSTASVCVGGFLAEFSEQMSIWSILESLLHRQPASAGRDFSACPLRLEGNALLTVLARVSSGFVSDNFLLKKKKKKRVRTAKDFF